MLGKGQLFIFCVWVYLFKETGLKLLLLSQITPSCQYSSALCFTSLAIASRQQSFQLKSCISFQSISYACSVHVALCAQTAHRHIPSSTTRTTLSIGSLSATRSASRQGLTWVCGRLFGLYEVWLDWLIHSSMLHVLIYANAARPSLFLRRELFWHPCSSELSLASPTILHLPGQEALG